MSLSVAACRCTACVACVATARGISPCRRTLPFAYLDDQAAPLPVEARAFEPANDAALSPAKSAAASATSATTAYLDLIVVAPLPSREQAPAWERYSTSEPD